MIDFNYLYNLLSEAKKKDFVGPKLRRGHYERINLPHDVVQSKWKKFLDDYKSDRSILPPESSERIWKGEDDEKEGGKPLGRKPAQRRIKGGGTKGDEDVSYGLKFKNQFNKLVADTLGFFSFDSEGKKFYSDINFYGDLMGICGNIAKQKNSRLKNNTPYVFGGVVTRLWSTEKSEAGARGKTGGAGILNPESTQNQRIRAKWIVSKDASGKEVGHLDPKDFDQVAGTLRRNAKNAAVNFIDNEDTRFRREKQYAQDSKGQDFEPSSRWTGGERESIGKVELPENMYELFKKYIETKDEKFYNDAKKLFDEIKSREVRSLKNAKEWQKFVDEVKDYSLNVATEKLAELSRLGMDADTEFMHDQFKKYITTKNKKFYDKAKTVFDNIKEKNNRDFKYSGEWQKFVDEVKDYPQNIAKEKLAELSLLGGMRIGSDFKVGYGSRKEETLHKAFIDKVKTKLNTYANFYELISDPEFYQRVQKMAIDAYEEFATFYSSAPATTKRFISNNEGQISDYVKGDFVNSLMSKYKDIFSRVNYIEPLKFIQNFVQDSLNSRHKNEKLPKISGNALRGYKQTIVKYKEALDIADIVLGKGEGEELSASEVVSRSALLGKPIKLDRANELITLIGKVKSQTEVAPEDLELGDFEVPERPSYKPQVEIDPDRDEVQWADIEAKSKKLAAIEQEKVNKQYNADLEKVKELEKEDDERVKNGEPRMYIKGEKLPPSQRGDEIDLGERGTYLGDLKDFGVPLEPLATLRKRIKALGHLIVYGPRTQGTKASRLARSLASDYERGPDVEFEPVQKGYRRYPGGTASTYELKPRKEAGMVRKFDDIMRMFPDPVMTKPPMTPPPVVAAPPKGKFSWSDVPSSRTSIEPLGTIDKTTPTAKTPMRPGIDPSHPMRFTRLEGYRNTEGKWKTLLEHMIDSRFPWMK